MYLLRTAVMALAISAPQSQCESGVCATSPSQYGMTVVATSPSQYVGGVCAATQYQQGMSVVATTTSQKSRVRVRARARFFRFQPVKRTFMLFRTCR